MAKIRPIDGKMTGKLGGRVYAVRGGVQVIRERPLTIYNPKSEAQNQARAKLKLLSQLSELMAPYIAIPRKGNVSPRNQFVKKNYSAVTWDDTLNQAAIVETGIQLTDSAFVLPALSVVRSAENLVSVQLSGVNAGSQLDSMVYIAFSRVYDTFKLVESKVVTDGGTNMQFPTQIGPVGSSQLVILAYGIRTMSERVRVYFGNMQTLSAEAIAKVVVTKAVSPSDILMTTTVGAESIPA